MPMITMFDPAVELIENIAQIPDRNAPITAIWNIKGLGTIKLTQTVKITISNTLIKKPPFYRLFSFYDISI